MDMHHDGVGVCMFAFLLYLNFFPPEYLVGKQSFLLSSLLQKVKLLIEQCRFRKSDCKLLPLNTATLSDYFLFSLTSFTPSISMQVWEFNPLIQWHSKIDYFCRFAESTARLQGETQSKRSSFDQ